VVEFVTVDLAVAVVIVAAVAVVEPIANQAVSADVLFAVVAVVVDTEVHVAALATGCVALVGDVAAVLVVEFAETADEADYSVN